MFSNTFPSRSYSEQFTNSFTRYQAKLGGLLGETAQEFARTNMLLDEVRW